MNLNHFILTGHLTRDPELRRTANGTSCATYTVASNVVRSDDRGKSNEHCDFIPITTFGGQAERDAKYLKKGSSVAVEGRIESWWQPERKRGGFNFKANRVQYLGKGNRPIAPPSAEQEAWVRDYERASQ
jgi:single-strand DNA-binding protein